MGVLSARDNLHERCKIRLKQRLAQSVQGCSYGALKNTSRWFGEIVSLLLLGLSLLVFFSFSFVLQWKEFHGLSVLGIPSPLSSLIVASYPALEQTKKSKLGPL